MFRILGNLVARFWPILLAVWGLALVLGWALAPSWEMVTKAGEISFLPETSPSVQAGKLYHDAFPFEYSPSNIVLVISNEDQPLRAQDFDFIKHELHQGLVSISTADKATPITKLRTPSDPRAGVLLVSPEKKAALILVELSTPIQDPRNNPVIDSIERLITRLGANHKIPVGLAISVTGSATAGRDLTRAEGASVKRIEIWTIVIVIVMLVMLYRAPLVAIIPLATVFVSVAVAISLLSALISAGALSAARDLRVFITVLAYGAGVDYCVFLIARFREELDAGANPKEAIASAIAKVGSAITASAGTVIFGIGMLAFAQFAKIQQAGLVIPFALVIALVATLTFAAAFLAMAGRWAFWPLHLPEDDLTRPPSAIRRFFNLSLLPDVWQRIGDVLIRRPGLIWLSTVAIMMPFVVLGIWHADDVNLNPLSDLPPNAASVIGTAALEKYFPPGALGSVIVLVRDERIDFTSDDGVARIGKLSNRLLERKDELALADVRSIALPLGVSAAAQEKLDQIKGKKATVEAVVRDEGLSYYVSQEGEMDTHVTRLELTLETNPLTQRGIETLVQILAALPSLLPAELAASHIEVAGTTANLRDLSDLKQSDEQLIQILVPAVVFVLLWLLFRRIVVSLYLIVSVLFSYVATLGLSFIVFQTIYGADFVGLDWKVPIFLFTILVAVGEDYNIFLLTRIKEEQARHGSLAAIPIALARTGRVISSCGFIMAGTFASLLSGSLQAMKELGFALAVGVLLDTLVVRPVLVPAFLVLLQRFFPGRFGQSMALGDAATWEPQHAASK